MNILRKYKFGFDIGGMIIFFVIMLPNFIWFVLQAPNDVLRGTSVTPFIDLIGSIFQVIMIATLCLVKRREKKTVHPIWKKLCIGSIIIYIFCWGVYYTGSANIVVLLSMCLFPCVAFISYETEKQNWIAEAPTIGFLICHMIYGVVNFAI